MRKLLFIITFICLLGEISVQAKEYTIKEIPMVHLQDRTRYVSNPDNILSPSAVATMDSILYALEEKAWAVWPAVSEPSRWKRVTKS